MFDFTESGGLGVDGSPHPPAHISSLNEPHPNYPQTFERVKLVPFTEVLATRSTQRRKCLRIHDHDPRPERRA